MDILDDRFGFRRDQHKIAEEAALDGLYVIRTSVDSDVLEAASTVRAYKGLSKVEIFFGFFKHILGSRHLLSHDQNGIEIQTCRAIIACMLISLWTGRKPTLRTYEMICFYFLGRGGGT